MDLVFTLARQMIVAAFVAMVMLVAGGTPGEAGDSHADHGHHASVSNHKHATADISQTAAHLGYSVTQHAVPKQRNHVGHGRHNNSADGSNAPHCPISLSQSHCKLCIAQVPTQVSGLRELRTFAVVLGLDHGWSTSASMLSTQLIGVKLLARGPPEVDHTLLRPLPLKLFSRFRI